MLLLSIASETRTQAQFHRRLKNQVNMWSYFSQITPGTFEYRVSLGKALNDENDENDTDYNFLWHLRRRITHENISIVTYKDNKV